LIIFSQGDNYQDRSPSGATNLPAQTAGARNTASSYHVTELPIGSASGLSGERLHAEKLATFQGGNGREKIVAYKHGNPTENHRPI